MENQDCPRPEGTQHIKRKKEKKESVETGELWNFFKNTKEKRKKIT